MKRYWVFVFDEFYPGGGMDDFINSFETINEAEIKIKGVSRFEQWHIFDNKTNKVILKSENYNPLNNNGLF